jgi:hypothetical protein
MVSILIKNCGEGKPLDRKNNERVADRETKYVHTRQPSIHPERLSLVNTHTHTHTTIIW